MEPIRPFCSISRLLTLNNQILAFGGTKAALKIVKEEVWPYLGNYLGQLSHSDLQRIEKYLMGYAASKMIREAAREHFYGLVAEVESAKPNAPVDEAAGQVDFTANENAPNQTLPSNNESAVNGGKESLEMQNLMQEILEEENLAKLLKGSGGVGNGSSESDAEESSQEVDPEMVNHFVPRNFKSFADAPEVTLEEETQPMNHKKWENLWQKEEGAAKTPDDEEVEAAMETLEIDPNTMDFDDIEARLPPYFLMSNKRKKKYFKGLMEDFRRKIKVRKSSKRIKKVSFNEKANQVVTFFKEAKLQTK